jgi:hypothetical protein
VVFALYDVYKILLKLRITVKNTGKALLRDKIYVPSGVVLMIVLSMW